MKLYYDTNTDKIVESGIFNSEVFSRDSNGNITVHKDGDISHLSLIGDVYNEPIELSEELNLELRKIEDNNSYHIQYGYSREGKLQEGLRFFIQGRGFNCYSTNLVVSSKRISSTRVEFYTLSGSHYRLEVKE